MARNKIPTNKIFTFPLLLMMVLYVLVSRTWAAVKSPKPSDIVAFIDPIVVTEFDMEECRKIFKIVNINAEIEKVNGKENIDKSCLNMVERANIARKSGVSLTEEEKSGLGSSLSLKSGNVVNIDDFCKKNGVSRKFLDNFLENLVLWQKHLAENIKRVVAGEVDERLIRDYMEYMGVSSEKTIYDLSKISIGYMDSEQRAKAMTTLNRIHDRLSNKKADFKPENFEHSKVEKITAIPETELHDTIVKNLKSVAVGDATRPFCIGNEKGTCLIFIVEKKELTRSVDEHEKTNVTEMVFSRVLENKIEKILENYSNETKIIYYR
jgi:hypothetical protein